ncbi:hypothetical protein B5P41_31325, partial [Bacillus sp. SRB_28]
MHFASACAHRMGDIIRGLTHRPTTGDIGEGLHASDVACAHLANDVGNRHGASAKACTHKPWRVRIDWASTAVACTHRPTIGDIGQQ